MRENFLIFCVMLLILCMSDVTDAATINFDGLPNFTDISQSYGDDLNPYVDIGYDVVNASSGESIDDPNANMRSWADPDNFGDLVDVATPYRGSYPSAYSGQVIFRPDAGYSVTLNAFDLAAWYEYGLKNVSVRIFDENRTVLWGDNYFIDGETHTSFEPNCSYDGTIYLEFRSNASNWVGIDNIDFTSSPVPIPGAVWLLGSGLLAMIGIRKRNS